MGQPAINILAVERGVPAEFRGQARMFRARMFAPPALASEPSMGRIRAKAFALLNRRQSGLRPDHLIEIERQWRTPQTVGRLGLTIRSLHALARHYERAINVCDRALLEDRS